MEAFGGAPAELIEALATEKQDFEVEPDCWDAVQMFMRLQTQWRVQDGFWLGIIYDSVVVLLDIEGVDDRREMFADLQVMEFAALQVLNDRKD